MPNSELLLIGLPYATLAQKRHDILCAGFFVTLGYAIVEMSVLQNNLPLSQSMALK